MPRHPETETETRGTTACPGQRCCYPPLFSCLLAFFLSCLPRTLVPYHDTKASSTTLTGPNAYKTSLHSHQGRKHSSAVSTILGASSVFVESEDSYRPHPWGTIPTRLSIPWMGFLGGIKLSPKTQLLRAHPMPRCLQKTIYVLEMRNPMILNTGRSKDLFLIASPRKERKVQRNSSQVPWLNKQRACQCHTPAAHPSRNLGGSSRLCEDLQHWDVLFGYM